MGQDVPTTRWWTNPTASATSVPWQDVLLEVGRLAPWRGSNEATKAAEAATVGALQAAFRARRDVPSGELRARLRRLATWGMVLTSLGRSAKGRKVRLWWLSAHGQAVLERRKG